MTVDVQGDHVLVDVLDHGQQLLAVELELDDGVGAVVTHDRGHLDEVDREVDVLDALFVQDTRDLAVAAQTACGAFAELLATLTLDDGGGNSHVVLLRV